MHNKKDCKNLISRIKFGDNSSIFVDILSFSNKTYTEKKQRTISVTMKKKFIVFDQKHWTEPP